MKVFRLQEYDYLEKALQESSQYQAEQLEIFRELSERIRQHIATQPDLDYTVAFQSNLHQANVFSKTIDLVVLDRVKDILVAINICAHKDVYAARSRYSMLQPINQVDEVFIYDYENKSWLGNGWTETSYSFVLGVPLEIFLGE